ncbi:MAG: hypothetical protein LRY51_09225 [Geovibrio sp.]|nr:hypothetical protein [Geovibrio sp.]
MIRQIITERFERVTFSGKYDEKKVSPLLKEADARFAVLNSLPVTPYSYPFLDEIYNRCIFSSLTVQKTNLNSEDALTSCAFFRTAITDLPRKKLSPTCA